MPNRADSWFCAKSSKSYGLTALVLPVAVGLVVSAVIVSAAGRAVSTLLYDVRPADPVTLACVAPTLLTIAAIACVMPARRAVARGVASVIRAE